MIAVLNEYLLIHKQLNLNGLGVLELKQAAANYDAAQQVLLAPGMHLSLHVQPQSLGAQQKLMAFIGKSLQVSEETAFELHQQFSKHCKEQLLQTGILNWPPWGRWVKTGTEEYVFEKDDLLQLLAPPVAAARVSQAGASHSMQVGDVETTTAHMTDYLEQKPARQKSYWWIYPLALGVLAAAAIVWKKWME
ncbi:MAG TPA: hypothetical protein PKD90_02505 [Phnomibacter sp.]|nr:hypothetical protein [Phnomibacter sp.]